MEEVLRDLLDGDYDSDDDFGGYFDDSGDGGEGSGEQGAGGGGEGDGDSDGEGGDGQGSSGSAAGIPEYRRQKGCTTDMSNKSPLDFFKLLITDAMLQQVVDQTILFAQQHIESQELPPRSRVHQWNSAPHTISELRKFLALLIAMGIVSYPKVEDAWMTTWPFASSSFSGIMSRDRFSLVMRFLHINDSTQYIPKGQPGYDPLYKIRPFLTPLLENCKTAYTLGREISVDESMIAFKGRLSFIQYLPNKPHKWGMKAYVLTDSVSGYTYSWRLYTGKSSLYMYINVGSFLVSMPVCVCVSSKCVCVCASSKCVHVNACAQA